MLLLLLLLLFLQPILKRLIRRRCARVRAIIRPTPKLVLRLRLRGRDAAILFLLTIIGKLLVGCVEGVCRHMLLPIVGFFRMSAMLDD